MKKVYVKAYLAYNLGDDLFVHILCNRYKNVHFQVMTNFLYTNDIFGENISLINRKKIKFINKIIRFLSLKKNSYENIMMKKNDLTLILGGSMFMECNNSPSKYFVGGKNDYYILGSNFGPYQTETYYNKFYNVFKNAKDVCFRDKYSYDLFSDLDNVRVASDIVFSLDTSLVPITDTQKVVISVIDCEKKIGSKYKSVYEDKIVDLINYFDNKGYIVTLMSFCKHEGDEDAILSILSKISDMQLRDKINTYFYNGNIKEALNVIGDSHIVVGSRFHANILGFVMNKTVIPIAYSDKTINVLNDCNFKGKMIDIREIDNFDISELNDADLNYKLDISKQIEDANHHFEKLDLVLERK